MQINAYTNTNHGTKEFITKFEQREIEDENKDNQDWKGYIGIGIFGTILVFSLLAIR